MKWHSYLQSAIDIVSEYDGKIPLSIFLKNFFRQHKQMGSRDRKMVASLVYNYFRLGCAWKDVDTDKKIFAGLFLTENSGSELLQFFHPKLNGNISLPLSEKINFLSYYFQPFHTTDIFPFVSELSNSIDKDNFVRSFLHQPDLFIRIRNNKVNDIIELLKSNNIFYSKLSENCLGFSNGINIETIIPDKSWYVIQDYTSQQTAKYFFVTKPDNIWDCCAGSGGKSILAHDVFPNAKLLVSDIRPSILHNLHYRLKEAGVTNYTASVLDLSKDIFTKMENQQFDLIILDAPCTGSGTWARTPEQLFFFDINQLIFFHDRQVQILQHVIPFLKKGGTLVYITCSVFKKENEDVVNIFINEELKLQKAGLIKGYDKHADTMFAAAIIKA